MIDFVIEPIIQYITDEVGHEEAYFKNAVKWYFKTTQHTTKRGSEDMREYFIQIQNIREIYQKGKVFAINMTKGQKKGHNFRWNYFTKLYIDQGKIDKATEYAKEHLDWIKRNHSERTYFRHKKKIKALGISV